MEMEKTAKKLKQHADNFPIDDCAQPAHPRHHTTHNNLKICFTRNKNIGSQDTYNLSLQHKNRAPSDTEINPLLPLFFENKNGSIEEVKDIATPNVRCFSQTVK